MPFKPGDRVLMDYEYKSGINSPILKLTGTVTKKGTYHNDFLDMDFVDVKWDHNHKELDLFKTGSGNNSNLKEQVGDGGWFPHRLTLLAPAFTGP